MSIRATISVCLGGVFLALGLSSTAPAQQVGQTNLNSDQGGIANNQDINLINPIGIARGTGTDWMLAVKGTGLSLTYDGAGNSNFISVAIPPAVSGGQGQPTGVVFNGTNFFNLPSTTTAAQFLFATADGTIAAYNNTYDPNNAYTVVNRNAKGASYTGLTIAESAPGSGVFYLYATNFAKGTIDVFDGSFNPVYRPVHCNESAQALASSFGIRTVPSPYNIQVLGTDLVIAYAIRGANGQPVVEDGKGFVLITDTDFHLIKYLSGCRKLNAPYGIAEAPANFGRLSHALLIANSGSGTIAAFDPFSGRFITLLLNGSTGAITPPQPLTIDGLHSLGFGAQFAADYPNYTFQFGPSQNGPFNALYFAAGPVAGTHGLFGNLIPPTAEFVLGEQ